MSITALDVPTLERLVAASVAAPSIHNTQPWRFRLDPDTVTLEIRAAVQRGLRHTDPSGRALHVSVGCALFNLRVAVAHHGWEPVSRLLPRPGEPDLLATLQLSGTSRLSATPRLYEALWRRHSSRFPFSGRPVPVSVLTELAEAAHAEGSVLDFPGTAETDRLLGLTREGERRNTADADRSAESRRWVHRPDDRSLGMPPEVTGPQDFRDRIPMRDFTARPHPSELLARTFETRPFIAVLSTLHDRRTDWLRAGEALERVLLLATAHGVRASLLHQALEWPDLRAQLVDGRRESAQMVLRLGYGPQGPSSPRRTARQVLTQDVRLDAYPAVPSPSSRTGRETPAGQPGDRSITPSCFAPPLPSSPAASRAAAGQAGADRARPRPGRPLPAENSVGHP